MMRLLLKSTVDFFRDGGPMLAGAISCFFLMSFVPFCLMIVTLLGYILGAHEQFYAFLSSTLVRFFPKVTHEIVAGLADLITYRGIGGVTLVIYAYFSYQFYLALETALNRIFKSAGRRSLLSSLAFSLLVVTAVVVLAVVSFLLTSAVMMLRHFTDLLPGLRIGGIASFILGFLLPLVLLTAATTALFKVVPLRIVRLVHALAGGFFAALLLETAKHLFTIYVSTKIAYLGSIYGPLSAFVIFLLWIFYSASIFLLGAEVVHNLTTAGERS